MTILFRLFLLVLTARLVGCAPPVPTDAGVLSFALGYRAAGDMCRRVGESAVTNQYLGDAADLVGCPANAENLGVFVTETGAVFLARVGDTNLYSVPRR